MAATGHIGHFEIRGQVGRGAMAVVWRAYDTTLERLVAIKEPILPEAMSEEARLEFYERFVREGKAAAQLNHPGIVTVYSANVIEGRPILVMELIPGPTLRTVLRHGGLDARQVFALVDQLLDALECAHGKGVVHRDLKPDNVFVNPDGQVKLADFGIAQMDSSTLTQIGTVMGTPAYMSPEQCRGNKTDARSDIFSLGVMAYEALSGTNPFGTGQTTNAATITYRIVNEDVPPLHEIDASTGNDITPVILTALRKDPAERYASAAAMRQAWRAAWPEPMDVRLALAGLSTRRTADVGTVEVAELTEQDMAAQAGFHPTVLDAPGTVLEAGGLGAATVLAAAAAGTVLEAGTVIASPTPPVAAPMQTPIAEAEEPTAFAGPPPSPPAPPASEAIAPPAEPASPEPAPAAPVQGAAPAQQRPGRKRVALIAAALIMGLALCAGAFAFANLREPTVAPPAAAPAQAPVAAAPTTPTVVTARKRTTLSQSVSRKKVVGKKTVVVKGRLKAGSRLVDGAVVTLERSTNGGKTWSRLGPRYVTTKGVVTVRVPVSKTTRFRFRFAGNDKLLGVTGKVSVVKYKKPSRKRRKWQKPPPVQPPL